MANQLTNRKEKIEFLKAFQAGDITLKDITPPLNYAALSDDELRRAAAIVDRRDSGVKPTEEEEIYCGGLMLKMRNYKPNE